MVFVENSLTAHEDAALFIFNDYGAKFVTVAFKLVRYYPMDRRILRNIPPMRNVQYISTVKSQCSNVTPVAG